MLRLLAAGLALAVAGCAMEPHDPHITAPDQVSLSVSQHWSVRMRTGALHLNFASLHIDPRHGGDMGCEIIWHENF